MRAASTLLLLCSACLATAGGCGTQKLTTVRFGPDDPGISERELQAAHKLGHRIATLTARAKR